MFPFYKRNKKLRILHSPTVALYQPYLMVKGLRELGHNVDYMVHNFRDTESKFARSYDFNLELNGTKGLEYEKGKELEFFDYAVKNYDIFHFHSGNGLFWEGYGLWNRLDELAYLKKIGKKIVMSWWGCDIRTEDVDIVNKWSACNYCIEENRNFCQKSDKKVMIEKVNKYVDIQLSSGDIVASYNQVNWMDNAIDTNEFTPIEYNNIPIEYRLPKTDKIRIYHSFGNSISRGDVKGSIEIRNSVERLIDEGYDLEFIYCNDIPNKDIKYYQAQADIVVDQLKCGWHGSTGVECLSMQKPVIVYIRPEVEKIIPHKHPLINANPDNIYDVLKSMLDNMENVKNIGIQSREYVLKYHDYKVIAKKLELLYESI